MPKKYWSIILALGLLLCGAASPPEGHGNGERVQAVADINQSLHDIAAALQEESKTHHIDEGCPDKKEDRSSDLCAQWRAADAAGASAIWAERAYWLATLGTFIGFLTLLAAGAAAKFARDAAIHTETGARASVASLEANRAWMTYSSVNIIRISELVSDGSEKESCAAVVHMKNTGNSPAIDAEISYKYFTVGIDEGLGEFEITADIPPNMSSMIGSGQPIHTSIMPISAEDYILFVNKKIRIIIEVVVFYKDIYTAKIENPPIHKTGSVISITFNGMFKNAEGNMSINPEMDFIRNYAD